MRSGTAGIYSQYPYLYDVIYAWDDYDKDSLFIAEMVQREAPEAKTLLDVACGTGVHLSHFKNQFEVTGLDFTPELLNIARERLPEVPLHQGDMRNFDLGEQFDVVTCFGNSIGYMTTVDDLLSSLQSLSRHVAPRGVLLIEPWLWPERFWVHRYTAGHVANDDSTVAWMQWTDREGHLSLFEIHYLFRTPAGIGHFIDHEEMGLFTDQEYRSAFEEAGLSPSFNTQAFRGYGMYVGRK